MLSNKNLCLLVPFLKRYREEISQVRNPNESEPEKERVNIRLTCSTAEKSSRRRTKKLNSIYTSTGWGTPATDFAKTVQLWEAQAVHWVFIPHHSEAMPQQFSSSGGCLPDNWTSGPGCCVISPTSCSFIIWKVVLREPLYPPPKSKIFFHQDHSWAHIFQGPHEDITSVTNNWEASYESHYPFNAMGTLSILSIVLTYSTVKLNGRYSSRFSIGETRHSLTKPKGKLLPKNKKQIAKCNLMSPTCNSFNH
jgi:hypothetical protein